MGYKERLTAIKGIGSSTADKIIAEYPTEEELELAIHEGNAAEWVERVPVLAEAFAVSSDESEEAAEEPKDEAPAEVSAPPKAPPTAAPKGFVNIVNKTNQVLKISYHEKGQPQMCRLMAWTPRQVPAIVVESPHFKDLEKRGSVGVV